MTLRLKNAAAALDSTSSTSIYSCPINFTARVKEIWIANIDGTNAATIILQWNDISAHPTGINYAIASTVSIAANDFLRITDTNVILEAGDSINAQASAANDLTVSLFIEEQLTISSRRV